MNAKALSEKQLGSGCGRGALFVFGLAFTVFGIGFLWMCVISPYLKTQKAKSWQEVPCEIVSSRVETTHSDDGTSHRPIVKYTYETDGGQFENDRHSFSIMSGSKSWAKDIVSKYKKGETHSCFFDPADPNESVLDRSMDYSFSAFYLPILIPGVFILIGVSICLAAIFAKNPKSKKVPAISADADTSRHNQPKFSASANLHEFTSGTHPEDKLDAEWSAPQKLKPEMSKWKMLLILLGIAIFWNGIVSVFVYGIIADEMSIWMRIGIGLFMTPFILIGLVLAFSVVYTFLSLFNPVVEVAISSGAAPVGGEVDIAWEVNGNPKRIRNLKLEIQGEQSAQYRRGTTTHTDTEIFELVPVCDVSDQTEIAFGSATIQIPASTMHTFDGGHNKVSWRIVVHGDVPWWPDVNAIYPFRVKPA